MITINRFKACGKISFLCMCMIFLLTLLNLSYMHMYIYHVVLSDELDKHNVLQNVMTCCMDISIATVIIYAITFGRCGLTMNIVYILSLFWSLINVTYSRFFYQYMPLSAFEAYENIQGGFLFDYLHLVFTKSDFILLGGFLIYCVSLYILYTKGERRNQSYVYRGFVAVMLLVVTLCLIIHHTISYNSPYTNFLSAEVRRKLIFDSALNYNYINFSQGIFYGQVVNYFSANINNSSIGCCEESEVLSYIKSREHINGNISFCPDSIKNKNIIYILAESYLSVTSDLTIDGMEVTPNLNRLKHIKGTYYNGAIESNVKMGASSDGQMICLSGLLPLRDAITVTKLDNIEIKGLPACLKKNAGIKATFMTIPSAPDFWKQTEMSRKYGIDSLIYPFKNSYKAFINDKELMDLAINTQKQCDQQGRSFHILLTSSTHCPYDNIDENIICKEFNPNFPESYSKKFQNYIRKCFYMDKQIGRLLDYLDISGNRNNTIIIVSADHCPDPKLLDMPTETLGYNKTPLYISCAGIDLTQCYNGNANQIDIYTTLLNLFGISNKWMGLGSNLLDKDAYTHSQYNLEKILNVSDFIIRNNYLIDFK